jgi:hypothetical protein
MAIGTEDEDVEYTPRKSARGEGQGRVVSQSRTNDVFTVWHLLEPFPGQLSLFIIILLTNKAHVASK